MLASFPDNLGSINSLNLSPDLNFALLRSEFKSNPITSSNLSSAVIFEK